MSPPTPKPDDDDPKDDNKPSTDKRSKHIYHNKTFDTFASVKGEVIHGLLIDPGAARGLIGADTLKNIIDHVLRPHGKHNQVKWHKSTNKFTGISADPQQSLGLCEIPIGLTGIPHSTFVADVIGGKSSNCPGLIPCQSLLNSGCLLACGYFPNGDGLLGIRASNGTFKCQLLLFTDSGHYLLPIHHFNTKTDSKLDTLIMHESQLLARSAPIPQTPRQQKKIPHKTPHMTFPVGLITEDANDDHVEMTTPPGLGNTQHLFQ